MSTNKDRRGFKNEFKVYVPNAFTPNDDEINDVFAPVFSSYGLEAKNYTMEIFVRWGHLVFSTHDVGKPWNGLVSGVQEEVKEDVYVYKIMYNDMNGTAYTKTGHLSLMK